MRKRLRGRDVERKMNEERMRRRKQQKQNRKVETRGNCSDKMGKGNEMRKGEQRNKIKREIRR